MVVQKTIQHEKSQAGHPDNLLTLLSCAYKSCQSKTGEPIKTPKCSILKKL